MIMDTIDNEIKRVKELESTYNHNVNKSHDNSQESIDSYIKWYNTALILFRKHIHKDDPDIHVFTDVDNSGNGYVLRDNYKKISAVYNIMIERIKSYDTTKIMNNNNKNIFIVHGHDNAIKLEVARLIEKIGYKAIILHEQPDAGRTIIEKLEENISNSCFGIVIYTGCDEGRCSGETELRKRARQNVVFEHGYLRAKLGPNRICSLYEENVELPTDLSGVLYKPIDKEGAWKYAIAKEMKAAGLEVNMNNI